MWFKKKSVLLAEHHYDTEKSADGSTDLRTIWKHYGNNSVNSDLPSAADAGNYFYLPGLASYYSGQVNGLGYGGNYWSSSADPWRINGAYYLDVNSGTASVASYDRDRGFRVGKFE